MSLAGLWNIGIALVVVAGLATLVGSSHTAGIVDSLLKGSGQVLRSAEGQAG